jgi:hypothetical protein
MMAAAQATVELAVVVAQPIQAEIPLWRRIKMFHFIEQHSRRSIKAIERRKYFDILSIYL